MATIATIRDSLGILAALGLERQPDDLGDTARAWGVVFADLADEELAAAVTAYVRDGQPWWPVPSTLRKLVPRLARAKAELDIDRSDEVWGEVREELRSRGQYSRQAWDAPTTAGIRACGGWEALCMAASADLSGSYRNVFRGAYRSVAGRDHVERRLAIAAGDAGVVVQQLADHLGGPPHGDAG